MSELKDSLLISIDILSSEDKALLIVGKKKPNKQTYRNYKRIRG